MNTPKTVKFVSAKPYLNVSVSEFEKLFFCLQGRKEVVVICSDGLRKTLKMLPSDFLQPRLIDIKAYLDSKNIPWIEDFSNTTTV